MFLKRFIAVMAVAFFTFSAQAGDKIVVETNKGKFVIETMPEMAPNHVARIKELVQSKFYDGIVFHRVIEGFMAQTGDPTGTGRHGSGVKIKAEFNNVPFERGIVGMARSQNVNSADSQWFVMFGSAPNLNGQYTAWGKVIEGMDVVDSIKKGYGANGSVSDPDYMIKVRLAN